MTRLTSLRNSRWREARIERSCDVFPAALGVAIGFEWRLVALGAVRWSSELVGERRWLTKEQMREAIAICQSLPGPLAIQVGIYVSYLRGGLLGRLGRRLGLHSSEFRDRRSARARSTSTSATSSR